MREVVADKGYHSNAVLTAQAEAGIRTYISGAESGPPELEREARSPRRGVREPPKDPRRSRQKPSSRARRESGTAICARLPNRRPATNPPARALEHREATSCPLRRFQPRATHARVLGGGTPRGLQRRSLAAFLALFVFSWLSDRLRPALDRLQVATRVFLAIQTKSVEPVQSDLSNLGALRYATGC